MEEDITVNSQGIDENIDYTLQPPTIEDAMVFVNKQPQIFKVQCCNCGLVKWVRKDIFANRVEKAYKIGSDLKSVIEKYNCAKCRKVNGVNFLGSKKVSNGSGQVLNKFEM